ncbi:MAG: 2-amino-4-hydroxy-6-hydroxymethyldihydropteridine diphosphokinase [Ferruginibacter sp.]
MYITAAWGNVKQADFLNQVVVVETALSARQMMHTILNIEKKMGRVRTVKNAPRIIDIDILFFNKEIIEEKRYLHTASTNTKQAFCTGANE